MRKLLIGLLVLGSLPVFGFQGRYKIDLPVGEATIEVNASGQASLKENPFNLLTLSSSTNGSYLDTTLSWMNDGSPELSRIVFEKNKSGMPKIREAYTVFNDGEPRLVLGGASLLKFEK